MGSTRHTVASGLVDEAFLREARGAARSVVTGRPTPTGSYRWPEDDIDDLVHETICRVGTDAIVLAAAKAATDGGFRKWLKRTMRTTLNARARRSPSGRLRRAIDEALGDDPEQFCSEGGRWRLASDERTEAWRGRRAELVRAAWTVETTSVRFSSTAEKTPKLGARKDIRAVCAAVLAESGPIDKADLAEVVAERFNAVHEAHFGYDDLSTVSEDPPDLSSVGSAEETVGDMMTAQWMFKQLTEEERTVLSAVRSGAGVRDVGELLGCGKDKAAAIKERVEAKIRGWVDGVPDDAQTAVELLLELCAT